MSKSLYAIPLVFGLALAGCNRTEAPETQAESPAAAAPAIPEKPVQNPSNRNTVAIGPGFTLPSGYTVRSTSTQGEGAAAAHVARAEYQGTPDAAGEKLRRSFADAGFKQANVSEGGDGSVTRIFRSADQQRVRVVFLPKGPGLQVELQSAESDGLATFYWQDPPAAE